MTYELWWVSADGQHAVHADYPERSYRTTDEAERAIPDALLDLLDRHDASDPYGDDPGGADRIKAGRWEIALSAEGEAQEARLATIPGSAQPVWGGWVWRTDDGDEWQWSKARTEEECRQIVAESVDTIPVSL